MNKELETKLIIIYNRYGLKTQLQKQIEESAELIQAIAKDDQKAIIEELADVFVVMQGILLNNPKWKEKFDLIVEAKINRQITRILNERTG